jgi:hypothetical protein
MNPYIKVCNGNSNAVWKHGMGSQDEPNWRAAQAMSRMQASQRFKQESVLFRACGTPGAQAKVQACDKK